MERMKQVWVLRIEQVQDGDVLCNDIFVYDNPNSAFCHLANFVAKEKKSISSDWIVSTSEDNSGRIVMWEAHEDGCYDTDHSLVEWYAYKVRRKFDL